MTRRRAVLLQYVGALLVAFASWQISPWATAIVAGVALVLLGVTLEDSENEEVS